MCVCVCVCVCVYACSSKCTAYATLTLARILVYAWFAHWLVPFRVNAGNIRGNVREDAEQCGQCVKCLTNISKFLKFVHDKIVELISRTIRELCVNYAQTSRTSACQCVPMRVHRPSDTLFTTSSRLSYEYFAHELRILPSQFAHTSRTVFAYFLHSFRMTGCMIDACATAYLLLWMVYLLKSNIAAQGLNCIWSLHEYQTNEHVIHFNNK